MKIFKAIKKIAKMKGEVLGLQKRIESNISIIDANEFEEKYDELMAAHAAKVTELVALKNAVMKANIEGGTYEAILKIGELKSEVAFLKGLIIKKGVVTHEYSDTKIRYHTQLTNVERNTKVKELEDVIDQLIEWLDDFNAKMDV